MVAFLIHRPVAVLISALAIVLLGLVTLVQLPVSLMPDIDIPEISVQINGHNQSAWELEGAVVAPLRRALLQVPKLKDIESQTRDGNALIQLRFSFGTQVDYDFLDVNEKIDAALAALPRGTERPHVIKASATDLPVFFLNISYKEDQTAPSKLIDLSEFAREVIRKRLEQIPEVALIDLSGQLFPEVQITPNQDQMNSLGISQKEIHEVLEENNLHLGNLLIREGQYQYNVRFSSFLKSTQDIENIYLNRQGRLIQLKDFARVELIAQIQEGAYLSQLKPSLALAVIKQADARMVELKAKVEELLRAFENDYPQIQFTLSQDQSRLLAFSIQNLIQSLVLGALLGFMILFLFLRDLKAPWLIGLSIPISIAFSFLMFFLLGISINIISISGLVLGIGLMIDNAIIVIDNISQLRQSGKSLTDACVEGTNEVMRPLISSALTTSAVFLPLIFLSGITGALFYDQAVAVTVGLAASLMVSISILPTLYHLFYANRSQLVSTQTRRNSTAFHDSLLIKIYEKGLAWVLRRPVAFLSILIVLGGWGAMLSSNIALSRLPKVEQTELQVQIDWNESLHVRANQQRVVELLEGIRPYWIHQDAQIGTQQFVLQSGPVQGQSEVKLYIQAEDAARLVQLEDTLTKWLTRHYSAAKCELSPPPNLFERLFADQEAPLVAYVSLKNDRSAPDVQALNAFIGELERAGPLRLNRLPIKRYQILVPRLELLQLYQISLTELYEVLKSAFRGRDLGTLQIRRTEIPIVLSMERASIQQVLAETYIQNRNGTSLSVSSLIRIEREYDYQVLTGGETGTFGKISIPADPEQSTDYIASLRAGIQAHPEWDFELGGSIAENKLQLQELFWILGIALLMLYFILAAQFESLLQPLIVLLEVPIDLAASILFLYYTGSSLNLMSMIGMIVMCGIIINDSILKIDTLNRLVKAGTPLRAAIYTAGHRRLRPIIMTSLTTMLAVTPFLFSTGLGADLQKPLAIALIGGMLIGTVVSLYFIPLVYGFFHPSKQ